MAFEELRALVAVIEAGSYLAAANSLGMSRSTLRRQVAALEASVGRPLLQRTRGGLEATDAGRHLMERGRSMEQEFKALVNSVRESPQRPSGLIRVLIQDGLPPDLLAMFARILKSNWPEVRIYAEFHATPLKADLREMDAVVWLGEADPGPAWETRTIVAAQPQLLAHASYLAEHGTPDTLEVLVHHDLLMWLPNPESERVLVTSTGREIALEPTVATANIHVLHQLAQKGLGIAWTPDANLPTAVTGEDLVRVLPDVVGHPLPFRIAVPRTLTAVPKVRAFLDQFELVRAVVLEAPPPR